MSQGFSSRMDSGGGGGGSRFDAMVQRNLQILSSQPIEKMQQEYLSQLERLHQLEILDLKLRFRLPALEEVEGYCDEIEELLDRLARETFLLGGPVLNESLLGEEPFFNANQVAGLTEVGKAWQLTLL